MAEYFEHSAASVEHFTPLHIVEAAREAMGGIDLDPFSCELANSVVRASAYYSAPEMNGFEREWSGRVFCNPPGGKVGKRSSQALAWLKLMNENAAGRVDMAVFICFNLGFLQVVQSYSLMTPLDLPICYPKTRISYLTPRLPAKPTKAQAASFEATGLCEGESPPGASCIVFLPRELDMGGLADINRFVKAFSPIGRVVVPAPPAYWRAA